MNKIALVGFALLTGTANIGNATENLAIKIDADDIGGFVTSSKGAEAGVWVIAETTDLSTTFAKIVVTDEQGRYVLPDLPQATYNIWVRGYGLVDSKPLKSKPGRTLNLTGVAAPNAKEAAEYYPASYWFSLVRIPSESEFPGTGPKGNGISPQLTRQHDWMALMKEGCQLCHQIGTKATRELVATSHSVEAWDMRVQRQRDADDDNRGDRVKSEANSKVMSNNMTRFGRARALKMFADWTDEIKAGALPPEPTRPQGLERNVVLNIWNYSELFLHDLSATDKRNPTVNAYGPVYGAQNHSGEVVGLDPKSNSVSRFQLTGFDGKWNKDLNNHTSAMDEKGRLWNSSIQKVGIHQRYCVDGSLNPSAKYYPRGETRIRTDESGNNSFDKSRDGSGDVIVMYDPMNKRSEVINVCYGSHHLQFLNASSTLFFSGDPNVIGWIDTKKWDDSHDPAKSTGWCPMVLDTNGDGLISADRMQWNEPAGAEVRMADVKKDTRISGFIYGMGMNPQDKSFWGVKSSPIMPSGIVRLEIGDNPPTTCKTEYYEPPKIGGKNAAFNARGLDVDSKGMVWVGFGSGVIGKFDRTRCKIIRGPTAIGQQCPEGWELITAPGPKFVGTDVPSNWFYNAWVDQHDTLGLGRDTPLFMDAASDALLAFLPGQNKLLQLRVPYPIGFYTRGVDGRIDDQAAGWKGRGLWAAYATQNPWHLEGGEGEQLRLVKFQLRPDSLAH